MCARWLCTRHALLWCDTSVKRSSATVPAPDERLPLAVLGLPARGRRRGWRPALEACTWCAIDAGPFMKWR